MSLASWIGGTRAAAAREARQMLRNRQLLFFCFILPLGWVLVVWGLLGDGVMQKVPVALVDQDRSSQSREILRAIGAARAVHFIRFEEPTPALDAMKAGDVYGVLLVPAGYGRNELKGEGGTLVLWLDENRYAVAGVLNTEISGALQAEKMDAAKLEFMRLGLAPTQAARATSIVHDEFVALGNLQTSFLVFLGSTLIPGLIMIAAMFGFVTAFLREAWHHSFADWIKCSGGRIGAAVCGKLLPWFAGYAMLFLFYLALFAGYGGNAASGSLWAWIALGLACLAAFAGSAIVVAAIAPTWRMALVISAGYAGPALPFSGFSMPLDSMSLAVAAFGRCLPLTWYIQGQSQAWTLGADFGQMVTPFAGLTCLIIVTWSAGLPLMRWSANRHARKGAGA